MTVNYLKKIFLILFLDLFAYSVIMPLLPILFLDSDYFLQDYDHSQKVMFLGFVYATYPLFQILCSPIWAKMADRIGRKRMLQISFIGNFFGYLFSSIGVLQGQLIYLLVGYAIAGCLGVNLSTVNALISDHSQGPNRVRYFGVVNFVLGLAFAMGPYLSSLLVPQVPHVETLALVVFLMASFLALVNFLIVSTIKQPLPKQDVDRIAPIDYKYLAKAAAIPLAVIFLTTFGWNIFIKTFQIFLLQSGAYKASEVLKFVAFYGVSQVLAQGVFITKIYKNLSSKVSLSFGIAGLSVSIALFVVQPGLMSLHFHILAIAFFQSMINPNLLGLFSKNHSSDIHGQMMSAHMGIVSMAKILAPVISSFIIAISPGFSLMASSTILALSSGLLPFLFKERLVKASQS